MNTHAYLVLPLCIAPGEHHFTIPSGFTVATYAVCTRCGLIRELKR